MYSAVHFSAVQCSAEQKMAVLYSTVQFSAVQCSAEQCPAGRTGTEATFIRGALHCTVLVHYILILP